MFQDNPRNPTSNGRNSDWSLLVSYVTEMLYRDQRESPRSRLGIITFGETANLIVRLEERPAVSEIERRLLAIRVSISAAHSS